MNAVAFAPIWMTAKTAGTPPCDLVLAQLVASKELIAYTAAIDEAAVMVTELSTNIIEPKKEPALP